MPKLRSDVGEASVVDIEMIEQLLCYFQADCAKAVDAMGAKAGLALQANVAIAATEAYVAKICKKSFKAQLLEATTRYYDQLTDHAKQRGVKLPVLKGYGDNPQSWID